MSEENVDVIRHLVEAWNRRDVDRFISQFDSDCEVVFPPVVPEPGPFHGHDELRRWVDGFLAAWTSHRAEVLELKDAADTILVTLRLIGRGGGSGIEMDQVDTHVFELRDGRVARWQNFDDRARALDAAGLSE